MLDNITQKKILDLKKKYSIYSTWSDPELFKTIIDGLTEPFMKDGIDKVLGLESRGFILGAPVAYLLGCGFVVARKEGKMYVKYDANDVHSVKTIDYSGKEKILEIEKHEKGISKGDKVLVVDDWFETGGQGSAAIELVKKAGGIVAGISIMLDDMTSEVRERFSMYKLNTLVVKELFK